VNNINLVNGLSQYQSALVLIPSIRYNDILTLIPKQFSEEKICYVTLNKTHNSLKELFERENGINLENIVFIDAITRCMTKAENADDCYFVSSPEALTELSIVITEFLQQKFDYIIFDSITTLLIYQKTEESIIKFISNIVGKIRTYDCKGIFYVLDIEKHRLLIEEASMVIDKVIDLGKEDLLKI